MERFFFGCAGGDAGGGSDGDAVVAFCVGIGDIRLWKRSPDEWCVLLRGPGKWCVLLPLNP